MGKAALMQAPRMWLTFSFHPGEKQKPRFAATCWWQWVPANRRTAAGLKTLDCFRMSPGAQTQLTQSRGDPQGYHLKHLFNNYLLWTCCTLSQRGERKMIKMRLLPLIRLTLFHWGTWSKHYLKHLRSFNKIFFLNIANKIRTIF